MNENKALPAVILGLALVLGLTVFGFFYYYAQAGQSKDSLSVTGSTKTAVVSDQAKIIISLSRTVTSDSLSAGYSGIAHDLTLLKNLLKNNNVDSSMIIEGPVSMNQMYDSNGSTVIRYQLQQQITVQSDDVKKITDISKNIPDLASQGAIVSVQSLEYYYSKLPELRVSLLTQAIEDAKARAEKIAAGTGRHVGAVQAASSGVVQVMTPNSVEVSDYGSYDTSSINKDIMVTVKASFRLK